MDTEDHFSHNKIKWLNQATYSRWTRLLDWTGGLTLKIILHFLTRNPSSFLLAYSHFVDEACNVLDWIAYKYTLEHYSV